MDILFVTAHIKCTYKTRYADLQKHDNESDLNYVGLVAAEPF